MLKRDGEAMSQNQIDEHIHDDELHERPPEFDPQLEGEYRSPVLMRVMHQYCVVVFLPFVYAKLVQHSRHDSNLDFACFFARSARLYILYLLLYGSNRQRANNEAYLYCFLCFTYNKYFLAD